MNSDIEIRKRRLQEDIEVAKRELKINIENIKPLDYVKPDFGYIKNQFNAIATKLRLKLS